MIWINLENITLSWKTTDYLNLIKYSMILSNMTYVIFNSIDQLADLILIIYIYASEFSSRMRSSIIKDLNKSVNDHVLYLLFKKNSSCIIYIDLRYLVVIKRSISSLSKMFMSSLSRKIKNATYVKTYNDDACQRLISYFRA